jgi:glycosyltransferase involved in cell wall biosynthesis
VKLGVIVPAKDEEALIGRCLDTLVPFRDAGDPVIVVDNGSVDGTAAIARARGFTVMPEPRAGRARAIGTGYAALRERCDWILIVHADMAIAPRTREAIACAAGTIPGLVGGSLGHTIDDPRAIFRLIEAGNRFRARVLRRPYGDQGQFWKVAAIEATGGFPDVDCLEDLLLARRLARVGTVAYLDQPVGITARHWRDGVLRVTLRNWWTFATSAAASHSGR